MTSRHTPLLAAVFTLCVCVASASAQTLYRLRYICVSGGPGCTLYDLNDAARAVGGQFGGAGGRIWDPRTGWRPLPPLPGAPNPVGPWGINDLGQVCGQGQNAAGGLEAFFWDEASGITPLGEIMDILPHGYNSFAIAINNRGHVTGSGRWYAYGHGLVQMAFLWQPETGMIPLGGVPGGLEWTYGQGINDHDAVVGVAYLTGTRTTGFLWTPETGMLDLSTIAAPPDWRVVRARNINNFGQIVGNAQPRSGAIGVGFFWDPMLGFRTLGAYPSPATDPRDINNAGVVVGRAGGPPFYAFRWDMRGGLRDLNKLLDAESWGRRTRVLDTGHAINDRGQVLVSWSSSESAILTPFVLGDMNDDGLVNAWDIAGFAEVLVDREAFAAARPDCWHEGWAADLNQDARIDVRDIDPFLRAIADFSGPKLPAWNCPINLPAHAGDTTHDQNAELPPRARPGSAGE
ncbi:MAG: hypothetical protein AB7Q17_17530 [Phycisphaerae bacterium]